MRIELNKDLIAVLLKPDDLDIGRGSIESMSEHW